MKQFLALMVFFMTTAVFAKSESWERFNSSLLIEVTRPHGVFTCTGVAVSPEIIVTAAHCLEGAVKSVRIFTQEKYDPRQAALKIRNFSLHPNYHPELSRYQSDVAKIKLAEKLPSFIRIYPIMKGKNISGEIYRFGFGARNDKNIRTVITPTLKYVNLKENVLELNDEFSRSGDSGGPIFLKNGDEISLLAIHSTYSFGPLGNSSLNPILEGFTSWIFNP